MSDILEVTETFITRSVNGKPYKFRFLSAYDRAEMLRADLKRRQDLHAEHREKLIGNLKLSGINGEQMFAELEEFDHSKPTGADENDWIRLVNDVIYGVEIFQRSLSEYGAEAEAIAKATVLPLSDKAKICGLSVFTQAQGGGSQDPPFRPDQTYSSTPPSSTGEKPKQD